MSENRKKPGVAFWATAVVVVGLVAYPLSFGPACWLADRRILPIHETATIYKPILAVAYCGPVPMQGALQRYGRLLKPHARDPAMLFMALDAQVIHSTYRPAILRPGSLRY